MSTRDETSSLSSRSHETKKKCINEEIESIKPYSFRPFLLHLNIGPFFLAYIVWFCVWTLHLGVDEYPEIGMIVTAGLGILQVVTCLFCYWFVEFRCFMQCYKVENPEQAEVVQVTPTANNGFAELVYLHKKYNVRSITFLKFIWSSKKRSIILFIFER